MLDISEEAFKKADEIYAKEEEDNSHHSTCSLSSCSICSNSDYSELDENLSDGSIDDDALNQDQTDRPLVQMKKSLSEDILYHPPLPKFPRYQVRPSNDPIPPLPLVNIESKKKSSSSNNMRNEQLTTRSLDKLNTQFDDAMPRIAQNPMAFKNQQSSVLEILPLPNNEIDQTLGIPIMNDRMENMIGMAFYPSLGPHSSNNNNDQQSYQIPTTIHQYPLISATIPSTSHAKMTEFNVHSMQFNTVAKEPMMNASPASILSNPSQPGNSSMSNLSGKKDSGEKNKVKFSDTIHVAVVPEISRKEKFYNPNERTKSRRGMTDPRRELAESLPLYNPEDEYLKDFTPVSDNRKNLSPSNRNNVEENKKKSNIKVVHFGVV